MQNMPDLYNNEEISLKKLNVADKHDCYRKMIREHEFKYLHP